MHWIETVFGLSPDNGDGSLEVAIALALVAVAALLVAAAFRRRPKAAPSTSRR